MYDNDDHIYEVDFVMIITYPYLSFMMLEGSQHFYANICLL